jgi:serine-type D-Ala-D-Ala carboxypeptidase (penicillin-binding protein 5/6)
MRARPSLPVLLLLAAVLVVAAAHPCAAAPTTAASAGQPRPPGPRVGTRYAILVDAASGEVLWRRNSRRPRAPASLTKMLTALIVRASLDPNGQAVASREVARQPARRLALRRGQRLTVAQALQALMIVSANDVAVMLAEAAAGSVARFARAMNAESQLLGLHDSRWRNPHGLDAGAHRSSAFDLAILARAALRDRWLARVVRTRSAAFTSPDHHRHTLVARSRFLLGYRGAVGVKTGLTDDAGHCLAAAATRRGRTLIAVVLHSPDNAADAGRLLDWGFGPGRSVRTGLRLPAYVRPASVSALLVRPPSSLQRHRAAGTAASVGPGGSGGALAAPPAGRGPAGWRALFAPTLRTPVGAAAALGVALLAAAALLLRRRRAT